MKIALAGFMAVGKSTIGKLLAEEIGLQFVDLDREIEKHAGSSIPALFQISEEYFREKEEEVLTLMLKREDIVLALGGGTLHFGKNVQYVQEYFQIYTLQAAWDIVEERIVASNRPLVKEAKDLFQNRKIGYEKIGIQLDTDGKSPEEIVQEIVRQIRK